MNRCKTKFRRLAEQWHRRSSASNCLKNGKWTGSIDDPLEHLLTHVGEFVAWVEKQMADPENRSYLGAKQLLPTEASDARSPLKNARRRVE